MLKGVKKGIKKKIKGKKDKNKEDDLFDPEQLEKYKRELEEAKKARQQQEEESGYAGAAAAGPSGAGHEDDEEWQRFKMLTSGVDVLVNKVSDDLERIKESSFFQRNKVSEQNRLFASERPSNYKEPEPEPEPAPEDLLGGEGDENDQNVPEGTEGGEDDPNKVPDSPDIAPVELDDSLFDTTFVEAIATGDIKLAYIPDSPTHEDGDDPFDTSAVADVVKRIEEEEKKAKRQVNLGNTVDFLTGKVDKTAIERPRARAGETKAKARPRPHAINLLGDFEDGSAPTAPPVDNSKKGNEKKDKPTDLFDKILDTPIKDTASPLLEKADILLAKAASDANDAKKEGEPASPKDKGIKDVISEFDIISQLDPITGGGDADSLPPPVPSSIPSSIAALLAPAAPVEDELDDEFAALAAESIHKNQPPPEEEPEEEEEDPFDTSYVEKTAAHGKCELKIIEDEVLGGVKAGEGAKPAGDDDDDFDFDPRAGESPPKSLEIQNAPKANPLEDLSPIAVKAPTIQPHVKADGPTLVETDGEKKSLPEEDIDPFDTSKLETVLPGKAELKLLEKELLSSVEQAKLEQPKLPEKIATAIIKSQQTEEDDFDFDPRQGEVKQHMLDLHDVSHQAFDTVSKVLTPQLEQDVEIDPFDTSAVAASGLIPGPLELKLLEDELVTPTAEATVVVSQPKITRGGSDDDFDFDPRCGQPAPQLVPKPPEDIFDSAMDFAVDKPLTPLQELPSTVVPEPKLCPANVEDPFDTTGIQIENYLAKSELRQVEEELLNAPSQPMPVRTLPVVVAVEFKRPPPQPVIVPEPQPPAPAHILEALTPIDDSIKPLTPVEAPTAGVISVFNPNPTREIDPFDTSIAEGVIPGKTEIKLLEEELGVGGGRRLSDPEFDPRGPNHPGNQMVSHPVTPMPIQPVGVVMKPVSAPVAQPADVDPFDTSAAETVMPGKAELKALENELL